MAQQRINPKLADAMLAQADAEQEQEETAYPDQSDYVPPWLELDRIKQEHATDGDEVFFQVFRQGAAGIKDLAFIRSVPQDAFNYELLQNPPFNGGKFRVYIRKENVPGIRRNFLINVEPGPNAVLPGQVAPATDSTAALIAAMSQGFQNLQQQLARAPAPPQGMGVQDVLQIMATLKPLMVPTQTTPAPDPFAMLTKLVELQKAVMPIPTDGDNGINATAVLLKAMDAFAPVLANGLNKPQAAQPEQIIQNPAPPALAAPEGYTPPVNDNPAQPVQENATMDELKLKVGMIAPMILLAAHNNADTYPYACNVLDLFDDEQIAKYIAADDWWTQLTAILPDAATHQAWFTKLREEVLTLLQSDAEPDSVTGTSP